MGDYTELKRLAEDVNRNFPDKEELWSMVCTPTVAMDLIASAEQFEQDYKDVVGSIELRDIEINRLKTENEALRKAALAAREFIMHEAEVRGFLDENNEVSFRHPRRQAVVAALDAAMAKGEQP